MMPGRDGYEVLKALRASAETRDLPVILLSARAGEEAAIEGLEAGADDYLPKPFSGRELLARVRAHLDLSTLRREAAAELRAEQRRLEQTVQQMPAGVMLAEAPSRRIVISNRQAAEILGHGPCPTRCSDYDGYELYTLQRERLKRDEGPLARAMLTGEVVEDQDMLYIRGDGRTIVVRISAAPVRDEAGRGRRRRARLPGRLRARAHRAAAGRSARHPGAHRQRGVAAARAGVDRAHAWRSCPRVRPRARSCC